VPPTITAAATPRDSIRSFSFGRYSRPITVMQAGAVHNNRTLSATHPQQLLLLLVTGPCQAVAAATTD
jgi:hypothetical protein